MAGHSFIFLNLIEMRKDRVRDLPLWKVPLTGSNGCTWTGIFPHNIFMTLYLCQGGPNGKEKWEAKKGR